MSRLISDEQLESATRGTLNAAADVDGKQRVEDYLERVAKLIPIEIIAAFIAIRQWAPPTGTPGAWPAAVEIMVYIVLVCLTPTYLMVFGGRASTKKRQAILATFSFVVWSYGIGGPFFFKALENALGFRIEYQGLSAAIVVLWSLSLGLFMRRRS